MVVVKGYMVQPEESNDIFPKFAVGENSTRLIYDLYFLEEDEYLVETSRAPEGFVYFITSDGARVIVLPEDGPRPAGLWSSPTGSFNDGSFRHAGVVDFSRSDLEVVRTVPLGGAEHSSALSTRPQSMNWNTILPGVVDFGDHIVAGPVQTDETDLFGVLRIEKSTWTGELLLCEVTHSQYPNDQPVTTGQYAYLSSPEIGGSLFLGVKFSNFPVVTGWFIDAVTGESTEQALPELQFAPGINSATITGAFPIGGNEFFVTNDGGSNAHHCRIVNGKVEVIRAVEWGDGFDPASLAAYEYGQYGVERVGDHVYMVGMDGKLNIIDVNDTGIEAYLDFAGVVSDSHRLPGQVAHSVGEYRIVSVNPLDGSSNVGRYELEYSASPTPIDVINFPDVDYEGDLVIHGTDRYVYTARGAGSGEIAVFDLDTGEATVHSLGLASAGSMVGLFSYRKNFVDALGNLVFLVEDYLCKISPDGQTLEKHTLPAQFVGSPTVGVGFIDGELVIFNGWLTGSVQSDGVAFIR